MDDGRWEAVEANDAVEEGPSNRSCCVGVTERNEVGVLGEAVNNGEDDGFVADLGQPLDEVHADVRPHLRRNFQWLQQPCRLPGLRLVALTGGTGPHPILNQGTVIGDVEVGTEAVQRLLNTLVAGAVSQLKGLVA